MLKETLVLVGQTLNKRQTNREKLLFINTIAAPLLAEGIKAEVHRNPNKKVKSNNLQIGNLNNSDTIFVSGYDTASRMLKPHTQYYPLNADINRKNEKINLLIYAAVTIIAIISMFFASKMILAADFYLKLLGTIIDAGMIFLLIFSLKMASSGVNMNRNSAACALMFELAKHKADNCSYVYTDQSIQSYLGYLQLANWLKSINDKRFIILDSLSSGSNLCVAAAENDEFSKRLAKNLTANFIALNKVELANSPLSCYPKATLIFCGEMIDDQWTVKDSRNSSDYHIDVNRLEKLLTDLQAVCIKKDK